MAAFPFFRWIALACIGACAGAIGAAAAAPADGASVPSPAIGFDSAKAYAHAGIEGSSAGDRGMGAYERSVNLLANAAGQGLVQAHAYRLVARFGAGSAYPRRKSPAVDGPSGPSAWTPNFTTGLSEASLRLRWGLPESDEGIQIGLMPLQGNPDAIVYGNYLARHRPYLTRERWELEAWDSLGALTPRVEGLRLALGREGGPFRGEGWLASDGKDWAWLAFLSGRAPRAIDWGVGASGLLASSRDELLAPGKGIASGDSGAGVILVDSLPASGDTAFYSFATLMFSVRAAVDIASLLGADAGGDAPGGRYGGLFVEAALLGWKEVPVFFPDRWSGFTWTVGMRVPTFGWLDACVAQAEWHREPEDGSGVFTATWIPADASRPRRPSPWRSALLLAKRIGPHVEVQARAATSRPASGREMALLGRIAFHLR